MKSELMAVFLVSHSEGVEVGDAGSWDEARGVAWSSWRCRVVGSGLEMEEEERREKEGDRGRGSATTTTGSEGHEGHKGDVMHSPIFATSTRSLTCCCSLAWRCGEGRREKNSSGRQSQLLPGWISITANGHDNLTTAAGVWYCHLPPLCLPLNDDDRKVPIGCHPRSS